MEGKDRETERETEEKIKRERGERERERETILVALKSKVVIISQQKNKKPLNINWERKAVGTGWKGGYVDKVSYTENKPKTISDC